MQKIENKIPPSDMRARIQTNPTGGGGGGGGRWWSNCFSREVTSFHLGNKWGGGGEGGGRIASRKRLPVFI